MASILPPASDLDAASALVSACENVRGTGEVNGMKGFFAGGEKNG